MRAITRREDWGTLGKKSREIAHCSPLPVDLTRSVREDAYSNFLLQDVENPLRGQMRKAVAGRFFNGISLRRAEKIGRNDPCLSRLRQIQTVPREIHCSMMGERKR
jgi:hypothetical protein